MPIGMQMPAYTSAQRSNLRSLGEWISARMMAMYTKVATLMIDHSQDNGCNDANGFSYMSPK